MSALQEAIAARDFAVKSLDALLRRSYPQGRAIRWRGVAGHVLGGQVERVIGNGALEVRGPAGSNTIIDSAEIAE